MKQNKQYLTDIIDVRRLRQDQFNLILSGVGTGKSTFALTQEGLVHKINKEFKMDITPCEMLFVTSRKIIVDQQSNDNDNIGKVYNNKQLSTVIQANLSLDSIKQEIPIITYNGFYYLLDKYTNLGEGKRIIDYFKIIVFDEAHAIIKDESFIKHMGKVKEFITSRLENEENKIFLIGMTATGELLNKYLGVPINEVLTEPFFKYVVDEIYLINPLDVYTTLMQCRGKTLILADTIDRAFELQKKIGDSAKVLISQSNPRYLNEMDNIRDYIINEKALPDNCDTLITTSCMREGINISSDKMIIENVVCYDVTTTTVMQFVGRYRGSVKRLILVNSGTNLGVKLPLENEEYKMFVELLKNDNRRYLDKLKNILKDGIDTKVIRSRELKHKNIIFKEYIEDNWLYKVIAVEKQKQDIVDYAIKLDIRDENGKKLTFKKIIELIEALGLIVLHKKKSIRVTKKIREGIEYVDLSSVNKISPYVIGRRMS